MKSLHQRRWCLLLCLCVVGLALAACSGGGDANHDNGRSESDDDDDDHPLDGAVIESIEPDEFENLLPTIVTITANKLPETVDEIRFADTLLENFTRLSATVVVVTVPSGFIPDVYDVQVEGNQGRVVALEGVTVRDALTPFAWLTGVVRDRDGEPIEGLDVFSTAGSDSSRTGSSGLFDLLVRQGPAELHALNSDWDGVPGIPIGETTLLAETYFTDDEQFDFTLRYHYLSGHIAGDDGDDLAAAGVQIFHVAEYGVVGAATTDFSGEFDIPLYPGDYTLLAIKSVLDGFAGLAFAASMGMGVTFSAITVLLFQGALTLGASPFQTILTDSMITEMSATGGVIILGIGFLLLEIKRVKVASFLPALFIAPMLTALWEKWGPQL